VTKKEKADPTLFVIPSEAELPFFGNSAQSRDLVSSLPILNQSFLSD